jgi:hypothetical protein
MVEMSERDKFMLDLNGFLVVEVSDRSLLQGC